MAHPLHDPHWWSIMDKRSMKSNRSSSLEGKDVDASSNTLCIGKDTPNLTTHGSMEKISMPQNCSKNSILTLPRLDEWMFKRTHTIHHFLIVSCPISWFTTSDMSCSSTPALKYPSHASTPYVPQSPQPSDHSSLHLASTFINSRPPTPQLAIRSAGPFPEGW